MKERNFKIDFQGETINVWYVTKRSTAIKLLSELMEKDVLFGLDSETAPYPEYINYPGAGLSPFLSRIRLLQIYDGHNSIVFDCDAIGSPDCFIKFLESKRFIAHNAVFDLSFLYCLGVTRMQIGCTYLLSKMLFHACYPNDNGLAASLEALSELVLQIPIKKHMQMSNWNEPVLSFEQLEYAALDAVLVLKIAEKLAPGLTNLKMQRAYELEKNAQHPITLMQLKGWKIDEELHKKMIVQWRDEAFAAKKQVQELTGLTKLTSSTLGAWLEKNLDPEILAFWPRTETDRLSTSANAFVEFGYLPVVAPFSNYQKKATLSSTFGNKLRERINPETKRLHGQFQLCGARTGRLSSRHPNLQNAVRSPSFEAKQKGAKDFRDIFIASEGKVLVCADYSQIELRVAAEISQDPAMLKAYRKGIDLHTLTASRVTGKPIDKVEKADRQFAKSLNFGLLYGLGATKFSHYAKKSYGVTVEYREAKRAIDVFRETYAGYRDWQVAQAETCSQTMEVRTPCGKLRKLDNITVYGGSMNTPIQGGAAEVMKYALINLFHSCKGTSKHLVSTVHDEVIIECNEDEVKETKQIMNRDMILGMLEVFPNGITRDLVDAKHGRTWGQAK